MSIRKSHGQMVRLGSLGTRAGILCDQLSNDIMKVPIMHLGRYEEGVIEDTCHSPNAFVIARLYVI